MAIKGLPNTNTMKFILFVVCAIISLNSYGQNFKKDLRPDSVKEDYMDEYQAGQMGNTTGGIKLKKHVERKHQYYLWRRFSETNWTLNSKTPMLVYSSSWYDKKFDLERSCGAVDLSKDKAATKELIDNSPHYFLISYKISE
jgi:hypothetical protein